MKISVVKKQKRDWLYEDYLLNNKYARLMRLSRITLLRMK